MNILITGNSQAGCLKRALDASSEDQYSQLKQADWIVVPGGYGPNLKLNNSNRIEITSFDPKFPPRYHPSDQVVHKCIDNYDVVIVSALGYTDGGFYYAGPVSSITSAHPVSLRLRNEASASVPVSRSCFYEIAAQKYCPGMVGFNFLRQLRAVFHGKILVQPFPMLSEGIRFQKDWALAKIYDDPISANKFMLDIKDAFLSAICSELSCIILPYPRAEWREIGFTPSVYIRPDDCFHPHDTYGELILDQIEKLL